MATPMDVEPPPEPYLANLSRGLSAVASSSSSASLMGLEAVSSHIARLEALKASLQRGGEKLQVDELVKDVKKRNGEVTKSMKDWGTAVGKMGKDVDKKFPGTLPELFPSPSTTADNEPTGPFSSASASAALNSAILSHLARLGALSTVSVLTAETSSPPLDPVLLEELRRLHEILGALDRGETSEALEWVKKEVKDEEMRETLEFELRKEDFVRLLLDGPLQAYKEGREPLLGASTAAPTPNVNAAMQYGSQHFCPLLKAEKKERMREAEALFTSVIFLPLSRLLSSPYAGIYNSYLSSTASSSSSETTVRSPDLRKKFTAAYLAHLDLPRASPLAVVADVGGAGAVARIVKVRGVMKAKRTEWSARDELPVEIPLPLPHRYHSIFACPVSKEQASSANPPMLMPCGHVIARDSLRRLGKGGTTVKCPYCPVVSHVNAALRVWF